MKIGIYMALSNVNNFAVTIWSLMTLITLTKHCKVVVKQREELSFWDRIMYEWEADIYA